MTEKRKSRDGAIALLLTGLFLVIIALLSVDQRGEAPKESLENPKASVNTLDLVNKHLREVYDRQDLERKSAEAMNSITAPPMAKTVPKYSDFHFDELPLTFEPDSVDQLVGKDLRIVVSDAMEKRPLNQQIQNEIIQEIKRAKEERRASEALAEAMKKKAANQGYKLEVDDEMKVKSVKKEEKPIEYKLEQASEYDDGED